ncbi:error-prone DNA polymerase [Ancrocorticia sp.]|uniref:error-prone DNA polymerase n=1 Tax=Ancrocorticia sp. TaxID=2593684 RepID=UPI003F8FE32D
MPKWAPYAELHVHSAYSFLDGASLPSELVERAVELELEAIALTDHDGFPGVVQHMEAARTLGMPTVFGTELTLPGESRDSQRAEDVQRAGQADPSGEHLLLLARNAQGYQSLSHTVGQAKLASGKKGEAHYNLEDLGERSRGQWLVLTGCRKSAVNRGLAGPSAAKQWAPAVARKEIERLISVFGRDNVAVELTDMGGPLDRERCDLLAGLAHDLDVEAVATGNVHYARATDRPVADVLAATRARRPLHAMDPYLPASGQYLRSGARMLQRHSDHPDAVAAAARVGRECSFDLNLLAPNLPPFPVPDGHTEATWLRELARRGARERYGSDNPVAWRQITHELDVIEQLGFPGYFLIVEEIVSFCHSQGIWCQGRGSAANSAVCFALGITAVDAVKHQMLFERFLSPGRSGPPDIDVDIESGRRELVIQHVYERYGRECAAQVANAITYRPRSAIRDAARALGYDQGQADQWAKNVEHRVPRRPGRVADLSKDLHREQTDELVATEGRQALMDSRWDIGEMPEEVGAIAGRLQRLPRHLGIHSGGMVLCDRPVIDVCPVGWATMPGRTVLQWDKDDCAEAGLVKFDLLGLGMLTALRISFTWLAENGVRGTDGRAPNLHNLPQEDPRVYQLLQAADTVGVFQVESRAQMATLPRLRPEVFYDIVIEVALIRPGPIQGQSVSPYLKRRRNREEITYPHELLRPALEKTLGVPLFQEQLMQIAIDAAGFTPAQADRLRKAISSKRSHERMEAIHAELLEGMSARGIDTTTGEEIFEKLQAFAEFGFPESHAFSFAYLVYASAWLKVHYPEEFYAGLLAAQPMGFYSPQSLVTDARHHDVLVLPPDVTASQEEASVEACEPRTFTEHGLVDAHAQKALRLGLTQIHGMKQAIAPILRARDECPFSSTADLAHRAKLSRQDLEALSSAGALRTLGTDRREGIWLAHSLEDQGTTHGMYYQPTIPGTQAPAHVPDLPQMSEAEQVNTDLRMTGISSSAYPTEFLRPDLNARDVFRIADLGHAQEGRRILVAGVVTHRQRPHTAQGVTFISLEDETGLLNVVCSHGLWQRYRHVARTSSGLVVRGMVERGDGAMNFVADRLEPLSLSVPLKSRDFR